MTPKPQNSSVLESEVLTAVSPSENAVISRVIPSPKDEEKIIRHADFTRMERPFGLDLHIFTIILLSVSHIFTIYSLYLTFTGVVPVSTIPFDFLFGYIGGLGITVGCHRYWAHKTFKANKPLQVIMMIMQTIALQFPIHKWSLDHRIHHKYTDTDADPHNSERGLWFSHMGWLISRKHPKFQKKLDTFDLSDLEKDPIVRFQSRWYWTLVILFHTILPVTLIYYIWEMPLLHCVAMNFRRYVFVLHITWAVNSFAHKFGDKPYDKSISSRENPFVAFWALGEGWHNYHHTFPWDYKASEFGWKINVSTIFIDFFASIGWASNMKTVSQKMLKDRLRRTGDGSHVEAKVQDDNQNDFDYSTPADVTQFMTAVEHPIWGWDDDKMTDDFKNITKILNPDKE